MRKEIKMINFNFLNYKKLLVLVAIFSVFMAVTSPITTNAASSNNNKSSGTGAGRESNCKTYNRLLTFPAWYEGLLDSKCDVAKPVGTADGLNKFIWTIVLNITECVLQIVGYLCAAYIIFGGYKYLTSSGTPDGMAKAKTTIQNAVIGLLLSIFSVGIVNVIAGAIK